MLAASWDEPEVHGHVTVKKHSAYRPTVSVQCAINRV